jgi:hypothetical protein
MHKTCDCCIGFVKFLKIKDYVFRIYVKKEISVKCFNGGGIAELPKIFLNICAFDIKTRKVIKELKVSKKVYDYVKKLFLNERNPRNEVGRVVKIIKKKKKRKK